ncbi:Ccc1 family [Amanita muscaria]
MATLSTTEKGSSSSSTLHKLIPSESHFNAADIIRDSIIGFADGLTVPFALTAGLSSLGSSKLVIIGGLAELFSGAISMGLGAYLAAVTDRDRYLNEEKHERQEVITKATAAKHDIIELFSEYGVCRDSSSAVAEDLAKDEDNWIRFIMDFKNKMEKPNVSRAWISAATMGFSYFFGGLLPMIPYFAITNVTHALFVSIAITFVVLLVFGFIKNYVTIKTKRAGFYGAVQTLIVGALAAATSYGIVRGINNNSMNG